ncbi:uncharacterized protein LOC127788620 isoform X2 [Diospyros lotus]|uniref:uncharacterized protein LOC127788620 isoform X2 n=2 Tax=Diospyros lotus TaxID=55363 RepID=UPI002254FFC1|nr:uncharacterized protein LOC127788620 isoform X2 [Diospyros lotus]
MDSMLQKKLWSYNCSYFPHSTLSIGNKSAMSFQLKFRKTMVSCVVKANQPRVFTLICQRNFHSFRSFVDGYRWASISWPGLKVGYSCDRPLDVWGSGFRSPYTCAYTKRPFSQIPRAIMNKVNNIGDGDGSNCGRTSASKLSNKHWIRAKSLAAHKRNGEVKVRVAASKQVQGMNASKSTNSPPVDKDAVHSSEQVLGNGSSPVGNSKKVNKAKGKQNKQSGNKKSKEKASGSTAVSDAAAQPEGSGKDPQAKKSSMTKKKQSSPTAKKNSTGIKSMDVPDNPVLTKQRFEGTSGRSSRSAKSMKGAKALVETPDLANVSSSNESTQKQKSHAIIKAKPQGQKTMPPLYPPTGKSIVVVESVTKAKVIQGYLGDMFEVLPSYGHVRDLAARSGSVRPHDDFSMVWEVPSAAWTHLKSIKVAIRGAKNLILASDPDREGEAIAWHIIEMLQQQEALHENINVARVVFNEITESSVKSALKFPRGIDVNLVHAYLARRALDYLIGFNISPLLWRKLPGCQSAGRVQSAALSLICDRELEIDKFKPQEYWTVDVEFNQRELGSLMNNFSFSSHLTHFDSKKLNQFSIGSQSEALEIEQRIKQSSFKVVGSKRNKIHRNPPTPFITSTLQQDAANKLHFTASYTMKLAQKLYEGVELSGGNAAGLITYMRTDGLYISDEAIKDIRMLVIERYGQDFAPESGRKYFKKVKNAQEAHEAIRPTDIRRLPSMLVGIVDEDSLKLYSLIWARTMACQMVPTIVDQIQLDIRNADESIAFRSTCSVVGFLGYQAVYEDLESKAVRSDENEGNDRAEAFKVYRNLNVGDLLDLGEVELKQHHTQPPSRYSEGSLVKKLEELGIGRPSTYATTLKVLQDRHYVTVKNRILDPEFRGRMVSAFLSQNFSEVTDYSFTADMETELDNVSAGLTEWKGLLRDYWTRFSRYCERAANLHIHQVEKMLEKTFGDFLFAALPDKSRTCPSCLEGTLIFKVSRFGAGYFIGCDQHPKCKYIAKTLYGDDEEEISPPNNQTVEKPQLLGLHPGSNEKILLKNGPYGFYIQLGEDRKGYLPKRASLSHIKDAHSITLEDAIELLQYPLTLGNHPEDGRPVILKLARFGFTIRYGRNIVSVPKNMKPNEMTLDQALELLSSKNVRQCGRPKSNKSKLEEAVEAL